MKVDKRLIKENSDAEIYECTFDEDEICVDRLTALYEDSGYKLGKKESISGLTIEYDPDKKIPYRLLGITVTSDKETKKVDTVIKPSLKTYLKMSVYDLELDDSYEEETLPEEVPEELDTQEQ